MAEENVEEFYELDVGYDQQLGGGVNVPCILMMSIVY
jgi:hypothetical protein